MSGDEERVNILIVDDRPSNLLSLAAILNDESYNVVTAKSGDEALALVLRNDFAVILLDVAMPRMDGFEVARIIKEREQSKRIPIIFVTASVYDMEHVFHGYDVGAVDYLLKPIDPHAVRAKVSVFVELYRQRRQIEQQSARLREAELREQRLLTERAEAALAESEAIYQLIFEQAPIGIGHATPDGEWSRINPRLCDLLGGAVIGRTVAEMASGGEGRAIARALEQIRAGELPLYSGEHELSRGLWATVVVSALRNGGGAVGRLIVLVDDISERKAIELERARLVRELKEGIAARDDFLSIAAHELKTPVTPLRLQAAGLEREATRNGVVDSERLARRLKVLERSITRLEELIDRLLDVSRLSVGKLVLEREALDLTVLVEDAATRLKEQAEDAGSAITVDGAEQVTGRWDRARIDQVVTNLMANAIKYGDGKPVEVTVTTEDGRARLVVRDHGIGIAEDAQRRIFERFERVAPVRHFSGFGLGLWITRQIVEAHGGTIHVRSRPGEGSEFIVELPLNLEAPSPSLSEGHP